jgi:succinate dehydrogenase / fumarate reductase iron-sulfur subunit
VNLTLHVWRQASAQDAGRFETYRAEGVDEHSSFLEMLDMVNEMLIRDGQLPIAYDHD